MTLVGLVAMSDIFQTEIKYKKQPPAPCYWSKIIVLLRKKTISFSGDNCDISKVTCPNCILVFYFHEKYHACFDFEGCSGFLLESHWATVFKKECEPQFKKISYVFTNYSDQSFRIKSALSLVQVEVYWQGGKNNKRTPVVFFLYVVLFI